MKAIIAGGRDFDNFHTLLITMVRLMNEGVKITEVVSGGAKGADKLGEDYAKKFDYPLKRFPANWKEYGKAAGPIRNAQMAEYAKGGMLIAFWDGKSRGTENMIYEAYARGLIVHIVKY